MNTDTKEKPIYKDKQAEFNMLKKYVIGSGHSFSDQTKTQRIHLLELEIQDEANKLKQKELNNKILTSKVIKRHSSKMIWLATGTFIVTFLNQGYSFLEDSGLLLIFKNFFIVN